jgi:hypothetical protein
MTMTQVCLCQSLKQEDYSMSARKIGARRRLVVVAAIATLVLFGGALAVLAAAPPFIDGFNTNQSSGPISIGNGATASDTTTNASDLDLLGGERNVYVHNVVAPLGQVVGVNVTAGKFTHSQNSQTTASSVLTYDGTGPGYPTTQHNGLCNPGCVDLTQGSTTNGFTINVDFDDLEMDVRIRVYDGSGSGRWSERTFVNLLPGATSGFSGPVFVEFPSIALGTTGPNGPANFANVGAVELEFIGKLQATDLTIDSISTSVFDWGDLPEDSSTCSSAPASGYATSDICKGPRHVVQGAGTLYMGTQLDPATAKLGEFDGQPTVGADGDDDNPVGQGNDEDGIIPVQGLSCTPIQVWCNGTNGGRIQATVTGTGGYLVGWIDFDGDGFEPTEVVINTAVGPGTALYNFNIPAGTIPTTGTKLLYARFRLFLDTEINGLSTNLLIPYQFDGRNGFNAFNNPGEILIQSKSGEVEDHRWVFSNGTLAVTLADLRAEAQSDHVLVTWETVSEVNNQGFNLYRSTSPDAAGEKINAALIPSQAPGSAQGAVYTWQDADVTAGTTYYYTLEDLDLSGASSLHGPVSAAFQAPTAVALGSLTASAGALPTAAPLAASVLAASAAAWLAIRRKRSR